MLEEVLSYAVRERNVFVTPDRNDLRRLLFRGRRLIDIVKLPKCFLEMFRSDVDTTEVSANSLICYINMYTQDKHLNTHVLR